jgi:hypothetical protein
MVAIAYRRLRHLRDQCLGEAQQQMLQLAASLEFCLQKVGPQTVGMAGTLHDRPARRTFATHEQ